MSGIKLVFDLHYQPTMFDSELEILAKQLEETYYLMYKVKHPFMYHFTSFGGKVEELLKLKTCFKWHIHYSNKDLFECDKFEVKDMIYLTSDADDVIEDISPDKVYIIGGIVDPLIKYNLSKDRADKHHV